VLWYTLCAVRLRDSVPSSAAYLLKSASHIIGQYLITSGKVIDVHDLAISESQASQDQSFVLWLGGTGRKQAVAYTVLFVLIDQSLQSLDRRANLES
jgi:hypothetical protein